MPYKINENCINCDDCYVVCPTGAIPETVDSIDPEVCISCGACGRVCEHAAIVDDSGRICKPVAPADRPCPVIDAGKCSACKLCIENCPVSALALSEPQHMADYELHCVLSAPELCVGCGMCERVCPIHAITMKARR